MAKMDKRSLRIIIGSLVCIVLVLILFIIAFRFSLDLTCELTHLDPIKSHENALKDFRKIKPVRSDDKVMLMKISAFFEYAQTNNNNNSQDRQSQRPATTLTATATTTARNDTPMLGAPVSPAAPSTQSSSSGVGPQPSQPSGGSLFESAGKSLGGSSAAPISRAGSAAAQSSSGLAALPHANVSMNASNSSTTKEAAQISNNNNNNKQTDSDARRYMPLELDSIESHKLGQFDDRTTEFVLNFNCSVLKLRVLRRPERVQIESIQVELNKPFGKHNKHSKCEINLASSNAFQTSQFAQVSPSSSSMQNATSQALFLGVEQPANGMAHYYCDKQRRLSCFHVSTSSTSNYQIERVHLGDLYLNALEFEVGAIVSPTEKRTHKKHDFIGLKVSNC